jgi:hypothetical protein
MKATIEQLQNIVTDYTELLKGMDEKELVFKPGPGKWSKKEILGHLIDSAQSNIRRFVVAQYEETPRIGYNQDKWVAISNYQHYPTSDLIALWALINKHICVILSNTSPQAAQRTCETSDPQPHTIAWLAADYAKHLLHHLHQVLNMEPVAYP